MQNEIESTGILCAECIRIYIRGRIFYISLDINFVRPDDVSEIAAITNFAFFADNLYSGNFSRHLHRGPSSFRPAVSFCFVPLETSRNCQFAQLTRVDYPKCATDTKKVIVVLLKKKVPLLNLR